MAKHAAGTLSSTTLGLAQNLLAEKGGNPQHQPIVWVILLYFKALLRLLSVSQVRCEINVTLFLGYEKFWV